MGIITVSDLGKAYKQYTNRWSRLAEWMIPGSRQRHTKVWVLRNINFKIKRGEAVGVLGVNGAGKSTLLKIITGTTQPTTGSVTITGRVAALLELGMGFHPDFTGRQNVYMSGQLLGYTVEDLNRLMPEIESFAEIGKYIDQPVRTYSSGMQMRLAFSVAVAKRPEILIVDEALAIGDIRFQQKCMKRIQAFRDEGTSLVLVTHDLGALYHFCDRAVYLKAGELAFFGDVKEAARLYELDLKIPQSNIPETLPAASFSEITTYFESGEKIFGSIFNKDLSEELIVVEEGSDIVVRVIADVSDILDPHVGFQIRNGRNHILYETNTSCQEMQVIYIANNIIEVDFCLSNTLRNGEYTISFGLASVEISKGSFEKIIIDQQGLKHFLVTRTDRKHWDGFTNMTRYR